jgi:Sulfotransferase family
MSGESMHNIPHAIQVTSFGGCGTSMLLKLFGEQRLEISRDHDSGEWKHLPSPPTRSSYQIPPNFRAVYMVRDPVDALLSVFRRKFHHWHAGRMQSNQLWPPGFDIQESASEPTWGIKQFVATKKDCFGLARQFDAWTTCPYEDRHYPIMVIKYESLWQNLTRLGDFVGLTRRQMIQFPGNVSPETSNTASEADRADLEGVYANLRSSIWSLPDCDVI